MQPLMTMSDIARLAGVSRQAVTNWRSRPAATPFPAAVTVLGGVERFDHDQILDWLEGTGRGRNREARLDAPALLAPEELDLERAVVLLALRAKVPHDIGSLSHEERVSLAREIDPDDGFLLAEVREFAGDADLAAYVDGLLEASYGPADALARLYEARPAQGSRGFAPDLIGLLRAVADAARSFLGPDGVAVDLRVEPRARQIAEGFSSVRTEGADREMLRHLLLDGLAFTDASEPCVHVLSAVGRSDSQALDLVDGVALDLADRQVGVVVGPASALCDRLVGDLYDARRRTLEMGTESLGCALAAAFRLPRGLWREAPRQSLGLWVLQGGTAASHVLAADLSGRDLDQVALADDVLGALERTDARAYRYGRVLPYSDVWTRDTVVVAGVGAAARASKGSASAHDRVIEATLVTREPIEGFDLPLRRHSGTTRPAPRSLGELVDSRAISLQRGSRVAAENFDANGSVRVLSADPSTPDHRIDALVAVDRYPHAARTEPGDVLFDAAPVPRARVDEQGGSIVATPSRILRVDPIRAGIGPRALAGVINATVTSSEWRTWLVPNVPRGQVPQLEEALGRVLDHVALLRRHEEAALSIVVDVIQGVAEGSVVLDSPTNERKAG